MVFEVSWRDYMLWGIGLNYNGENIDLIELGYLGF